MPTTIETVAPAKPPRQRTRAAAATRYAHIPDSYLICLFRRAHVIDNPPVPQKVRLILDDDGRYVDLFEYVGECRRCGCTRTQLKIQHDARTWSNEYDLPEGYRSPPGEPYDRAELYAEYLRRFKPAAGRPQVRKAPGVK